MICKHCGAEYDKYQAKCPYCASENEKNARKEKNKILNAYDKEAKKMEDDMIYQNEVTVAKWTKYILVVIGVIAVVGLFWVGINVIM